MLASPGFVNDDALADAIRLFDDSQHVVPKPRGLELAMASELGIERYYIGLKPGAYLTFRAFEERLAKFTSHQPRFIIRILQGPT